MILFCTSTDEATARCRSVAHQLAPLADHTLLDEGACRGSLEAALAAASSHLVALSHGGHDRVMGQDRLPAICPDNVAAASGRAVLAFACSSAITLGQVAVSNGVHAYWGYLDTVLLPDPSDLGPGSLVNFFNTAIDEGLNVRNMREAETVLESLRDECERLAALLVLNEARQPSIETYTALRYMWRRLACWLPLESTAIIHPQPDDLI